MANVNVVNKLRQMVPTLIKSGEDDVTVRVPARGTIEVDEDNMTPLMESQILNKVFKTKPISG